MTMANGHSELELELEHEGLGEGEGEFEFETEHEGIHEHEGTHEHEHEHEHMVNPVNRVYADAMMEHLGLAAMEAENEFEAAEHFLPLIGLAASKLLPLAAKKLAPKIIPRIARSITRVAPRLTRSIGRITRVLHRHPRRRYLVRTIPSTARRTVTTIARHAAAGRPVSPGQAVQILRRENRRVLSNPRIVRTVLRRAKAADRRFHRLSGHPYHGAPRMLARPGSVGPARGRAFVCPNCGARTMQGVRRVCCCC
jgi:hypothetical protein